MSGNPKNSQIADRLPLRIGLLGLGTVGTGFLEAVRGNPYLADNLILKKVLVRDLNKPRQVSIPDGLLTTDAYEVIGDPEIDVIVEVLGGELPAAEYMKDALEAGKHVVTANKEAVAKHGSSLARVAHESHRQFLFEASVGGGVPVISPLIRDLAANEITSIKAIINGTTNYILTQMTHYGGAFGDALAQAQELGSA